MKITKLIPWNIRIKSLYWVQKSKEINKELELIFSNIDNDNYKEARELLGISIDKWTEISHSAPNWFIEEYIPEFAKAEAMLNFLSAESADL